MEVAAETVATDAPTYAELLARVEALEAGQSPVKKKNKLTIIAWGGDLDRIWPTTILATTAAASGMESSVFFTFWGLFAIVKPGVRRSERTAWRTSRKRVSIVLPSRAVRLEQFRAARPAANLPWPRIVYVSPAR